MKYNCKDCPYTYLDYYNNDEEEYIWCDKVGGRVLWDGYCSDAYPDIPVNKHCPKKRRRNKRERYIKQQNYLKKLSKYCYEFYYIDRVYVRGKGYVDSPKPYYKRFYWSERAKRFYKKQSNKAVRRYKGGISKGNGYRKLYEYKWMID